MARSFQTLRTQSVEFFLPVAVFSQLLFSPNIIEATRSSKPTLLRKRETEWEPKSQTSCFLFSPFDYSEKFWGGNINAELFCQSDWYQNSVLAGLHAHTHPQRDTQLVCVFCGMTSRNIIQRALVFCPQGEKSWRAPRISIKIMQSVVLWLSG